MTPSLAEGLAVPLVDLQGQLATVRSEAEEAVLRVLRSGIYVAGPEVAAFEAAFARYCGTAHAVGVANGTDALRLTLQALGVGAGDEVVTVSHTFIATAEAIAHLGAVPRFVDVDAATGLMDATDLEAAVSERTKAVIAVHLYGRPARMDDICTVAGRYGVPVVEDASQAHGALHQGRRVGSLADAACFSFYPTKNLGAFGDGGAVTTHNAAIAERVRLLANHGSQEKYVHEVVGWNSRLDEAQAALLTIKLAHLDIWNSARRRHVDNYRSELSSVPGLELVPEDCEGDQSAHHLFVVRHGQRDHLQRRIREMGIGTAVHYPFGIHRQLAFEGSAGAGSLPRSEAWADTCLSLPLYAEMTDVAVEAVVRAVRDALGRP